MQYLDATSKTTMISIHFQGKPFNIMVIPQTVAHQVPLSMEFSRQKYWSGLSFPVPGDLPNPGIEPMSLESPALAGGFFITTTCLFFTKIVGPYYFDWQWLNEKIQAEIASPTQRMWIWANSRRQWRTEESGMLQSMGLQRVRHNLATEQNEQRGQSYGGWE